MPIRQMLAAATLLLATTQCHAFLRSDFTGDSNVDFQDFLIFSRNFGMDPATHEDGDVNEDGVIDFADFLLFSRDFGVQAGKEMLATQQDLTDALAAGLDDHTEYIVLANAAANYSGHIDIEDVEDTTICFEGPLKSGSAVNITDCSHLTVANLTAVASVRSNGSASYDDDYGVVNVIDSNPVTFLDLDVENTAIFAATTLQTETSCALNIDNSTVTVDSLETSGNKLKGNAKSVVMVHSDADVFIRDTTIDGYYFEVNVSASKFILQDSVLHQYNSHDPNDSHAAIYVSSTYSGVDQASDVTMKNVNFEMESGRPIVTGNTNADGVTSKVVLESPIRLKYVRDPAHSGTARAQRGLLNYDNGASQHIELELVGGTPQMWNTNGAAGPLGYFTPTLVDIITTHLHGEDFVVNASTDTFTVAGGHLFSNGQRVRVWTDGTLPAGLVQGDDYFVVNATSSTYQLATTFGGSVMNVGSTGSGAHTVGHSTSIVDPNSTAPVSNRYIALGKFINYSANLASEIVYPSGMTHKVVDSTGTTTSQSIYK